MCRDILVDSSGRKCDSNRYYNGFWPKGIGVAVSVLARWKSQCRDVKAHACVKELVQRNCIDRAWVGAL